LLNDKILTGNKLDKKIKKIAFVTWPERLVFIVARLLQHPAKST